MARKPYFPTATPVILKKGQNMVASPAWSQPGVSISINALPHPILCAPFGVWLEAVVTGDDVPTRAQSGTVRDPEMHDRYYRWHHHEKVSSTAPLNFTGLLEGWMTDEFAYGPKVAFCFQAGTHNVTLEVYNRIGVKLGQATYSVTVPTWETVYPQGKRFVVSSTGDYSGAPTHDASRRYTTLLSAVQAAAGSNGIILLKRGDNYTSEAQPRIRDGNHHLAPWGTGPKPLIRSIWVTNSEPIIMDSLDMRGPWDVVSETGAQIDNGFYISSSGFATFSECRVTGFGICMRIDDATPVSIVNNCELTDFADHAYAYGGPRSAVLGTTLTQNPLAGSGGAGKTNYNNKHGPVRIGSSAKYVYFSRCRVFSCTGWSTQTSLEYGNISSHQSPFRTSGGHLGLYIWLDRAFLEGGAVSLNLHDTANGGVAVPTNIVIDKAILLGSAATTTFGGTNFGGVTIRNIYGLIPNTKRLVDFNGRLSAYPLLPPDSLENERERTDIVGSCVVSNLSSEKANKASPPLIRIRRFAGGRVRCSSVHAPNHAGSPNAGPMREVSSFVPMFVSFQQKGKTTVPDASYGTPTSEGKLYALTPDNPLVGSVPLSEHPPLDDLTGRMRPILTGCTPWPIEPVLV